MGLEDHKLQGKTEQELREMADERYALQPTPYRAATDYYIVALCSSILCRYCTIVR
jgi:hypothetical protein